MAIANRAGQYVQQVEGYRAFIPKPLPPSPEIEMDQEMWNLLSLADRALGRLDGSTDALPNPDLFVFMYVRKEAVLSSQIEGTQASLIDVLEFESQTLDPDNPQDVEEVVNYIAAVNYGLERLQSLPVSLRLIREIHKKLMQGVRGAERSPGEFRRTQNWIGAGGCTLQDASYVPPPPHEMKLCLDNLEKFLHDLRPMPPLLKIGLAHAQFETIHPFLDGNGRAGRLLITFLLCEQQILQRPLLYISYYFKKYRTRYYDLLQGVRDAGDWESWLKFFLRGIAETANEAARTARQIVQLKEEHRILLLERMGRKSGNAIALLETLYFKPIFTVEHAMEVTRLSYPNANRLVKDLCNIGLLEEITGQKRNRAFCYAPYLAVFKDG
ncbi:MULTISPECIES: Fic family protein [Cyanophyceae]|uniref:Fic family protein n=1 Tax=Cyanophyceae TaxID=3028117 RepID=UPI00016DCCEB|nr:MULTISPECIES: Fic family protein [Cyanophyceae]ACB01031.1 Fic family protein [Picosynechococcus sp. PCC 7002]SMH58690.1 Fic family protein [Picosynechococcus sp. OG1]SMQ86381.1 Fic family protein [Synechococcus sp. 7002]